MCRFTNFENNKTSKRYYISGSTGSSASTTPCSVIFEQGETSIPADKFERKHRKTYIPKYRKQEKPRPISDEFIPGDLTI